MGCCQSTYCEDAVRRCTAFSRQLGRCLELGKVDLKERELLGEALVSFDTEHARLERDWLVRKGNSWRRACKVKRNQDIDQAR